MPKAPDLAALVNDPDPNPFPYIKNAAAYADSLSPGDIPGIMHQLEGMPDMGKTDMGKKMMLLNILSMRYADADPQGALAWSQKKSGGQFEYFMKRRAADLAYGTLAEQDPASALSQAQQMPAGQKRDEALSAVASKIAETDPVQALKLIQNTPNGNGNIYLGTAAVYGIFSKWAEKDPAQATQALLQLPAQRQNQAASAIAGSLVEKDPQSAVAWLNQLPAGRMRNDAQQAIAVKNPGASSGAFWNAN